MSYFYKTAPKDIVLMMKDKYDIDVFVETGTYVGSTAEWASSHFSVVHTIERLQDYYKIAENNLLHYRNVKMWMNDSREVLEAICHEINRKKTMFYLDAHWSEGAWYGKPLIESTALDEINIINKWNNLDHVIIVDDAHRFGTEGWVSKEDVVNALENNGLRSVRELMDVLVAVPSMSIKYTNRRGYARFDAPPANFVPFGRIGN